MAAPPGLAIEVSTLSNVSLGGGILNPTELVSIRRANGTLWYKATTHHGKVNSAAGLPIKELNGGIGAYLEECIRTFEMNFQFISEITGVDRISSITANNPNATATQSRLAVAGTNDVLKPLYAGVLYLKTHLAKSIAYRAMRAIKYMPQCKEAYYPVLGDSLLQCLLDSINSEKGLDELGIVLSPRITEEDRQRILMKAQEAMAVGKNGDTQITYDDYLMVERAMKNGDYKYAEMVLSYRIRKRRREQDERAANAIKQQNDLAAAADARAIEKLKIETELKTRSEVIIKATEHIFDKEASANQELSEIRKMILEQYIQPQESQQQAQPSEANQQPVMQ